MGCPPCEEKAAARNGVVVPPTVLVPSWAVTFALGEGADAPKVTIPDVMQAVDDLNDITEAFRKDSRLHNDLLKEGFLPYLHERIPDLPPLGLGHLDALYAGLYEHFYAKKKARSERFAALLT